MDLLHLTRNYLYARRNGLTHQSLLFICILLFHHFLSAWLLLGALHLQQGSESAQCSVQAYLQPTAIQNYDETSCEVMKPSIWHLRKDCFSSSELVKKGDVNLATLGCCDCACLIIGQKIGTRVLRLVRLAAHKTSCIVATNFYRSHGNEEKGLLHLPMILLK